ncbi:MAG: deoxycytidine triphosphate deaminase [Rhodospirillaceae bacterium]|nr:deoxycytidine triphosphate deaminase [Rhodospirillaceae bacterium]
MDDKTRTEIEAATFRRIVEHFRSHPDVQNIDLMELAGFCRNCLSKWYSSEAEARGETVSYDEARERVYGMPYSEWKTKFQKEQPKERLDSFQVHDHS